jgi:hypothetical protein
LFVCLFVVGFFFVGGGGLCVFGTNNINIKKKCYSHGTCVTGD